MLLGDLLSQKKADILGRWVNLTLDTYPPDTSRFFKEEGDSFSNPVGSTLRREMKALYEGLCRGEIDSDRLLASLDSIIRIRAIQSFSPSQAIGFVFLLKKAIREKVGKDAPGIGELSDFESKIDALALLAFDTYMKCREGIFELRVNQLRSERERAFHLLETISMRGGKLTTDETAE